jgi:hypothetical protein
LTHLKLTYGGDLYTIPIAFQEVPIPELLNGKIMQFFKMRLLLRLSKRDGELNINEQIAAILADPVKHPVFTSNADDAIFKYTGYTLIQSVF